MIESEVSPDPSLPTSPHEILRLSYRWTYQESLRSWRAVANAQGWGILRRLRVPGYIVLLTVVTGYLRFDWIRRLLQATPESVLASIVRHESLLLNAVPIVLLVLLMPVIIDVMVLINSALFYVRSPERGLVVQFTIGPDGLERRCAEIVRENFSWSAVTRVIETTRGFAILRGYMLGGWLPMGAFASMPELECFKKLAENRAAKYQKA